MKRHRKQLALTLVLASALIVDTATFLLPSSLQAQTQVQHNGIDSALLAKANTGDATSQSVIAYAYLKGDGMPQSYAQAAIWWRKAAEQGMASAQYNLGVSYHKGRGVPQDDTQAAFWWRKSADQGTAEAQYDLALLYHLGKGVPQDDVQAVSWYRKAADQGFANAQFVLGKMYFYGDTVSQDLEVAEIWNRKAADQGNVEAQKLLAILVAGKEHRREERNITIFSAICLIAPVGLVAVLIQNRERLIRKSRKLIPRTSRAKQFTVLLLVASWCSVCCLYQIFDTWMMRHPVDAVATALLFSAPSIVFGAVLLWWLSQANNDG
jgi:hypothetical protein